jgi:hypothetical protein
MIAAVLTPMVVTAVLAVEIGWLMAELLVVTCETWRIMTPAAIPG